MSDRAGRRAISRRRFLGVAAATVVAGTAGASVWRWLEEDRSSRPGELDASVRRIGERYLELNPAERDARRLEGRLGLEGHAAADPAELLPSLRVRSAYAFSDGQVVQVDGWVLSTVEARAAALAALIVPKG